MSEADSHFFIHGPCFAREVVGIKDMALAHEKRHISLRALAVHAQRIGKLFASATTGPSSFEPEVSRTWQSFRGRRR